MNINLMKSSFNQTFFFLIIIYVLLAVFTASLASAEVNVRSQCNNIIVEKCIDARDGVDLVNFGGTYYTLLNGCRDAGYGLRDYSLRCIDSRTYEVCWQSCERTDTSSTTSSRSSPPLSIRNVPIEERPLTVNPTPPQENSRCIDSDNGLDIMTYGWASGYDEVTDIMGTYYDSCSDEIGKEGFSRGQYAVEKHCSSVGNARHVPYVHTQWNTCSSGCISGQCQALSAANQRLVIPYVEDERISIIETEDSRSCTDTDGGDKPFVKGITSGINDAMLGGRTRVEDTCEGNTLREYICSPSRNTRYSPVVGLREYTCRSGCRVGTCLPGEVQDNYAEKTRSVVAPVSAAGSKPRCYDSDGGNDIYIQGKLQVQTSQWGKQVVYEYCSNEQRENLEEGAYVEELVCLTDDPQYAYTHVPTRCPPSTYCRQGACVREDNIQKDTSKEIVPAYDEQRCFDSDGVVFKQGNPLGPAYLRDTIYTDGYVMYGGKRYEDLCTTSSPELNDPDEGKQIFLVENVCVETNKGIMGKTFTLKCPQGNFCRSGACVRSLITENNIFDNTIHKSKDVVFEVAVNNYPDSEPSENIQGYVNVYNVIPIKQGVYRGKLRETLSTRKDGGGVGISVRYGEIVNFVGFKNQNNARLSTSWIFSSPPYKNFGVPDKLCQINFLNTHEYMYSDANSPNTNYPCATSSSTPYQDNNFLTNLKEYGNYYNDNYQMTEDLPIADDLINEKQAVCFNGCILDDRCLPYGYRTLIREQPVFCSITNDLQSQLNDGLSCENNHECLTNSCYNGKCVDIQKELEETQGALFKLLKRLQFLFK